MHKISFIFLLKSNIIQITVSLDLVHLQNKELFFTFYELLHGFSLQITIRTKLYISVAGLSKSLWHCCEGQLEKGHVEGNFLKTDLGNDTCPQKL